MRPFVGTEPSTHKVPLQLQRQCGTLFEHAEKRLSQDGEESSRSNSVLTT